MQGITLTFGDCAENHVGMQQLGVKASNGFTKQNMKNIISLFPNKEVVRCHLHRMGENFPKAYLYVVRNAITDHTQLFDRMKSLDWDKKALMKGRVVNKVARYNLCFDNFNQEPNYEKGMGRIININEVNELKRVYSNICSLDETRNMKIEGNYYYDMNKCYIGWHGDSERRKVIGIRLGCSFPIYYQWYKHCEPNSEKFSIMLNPGDLYIMSEKAVGTDWKRSSIVTLRHAAGNIL